MRSTRFQELVEKNPENELFRFSLAQALIKEDQPADAIPHLRLCIERKPDWMVAQIMLGKALLATDRPEEARGVLEEALRLAIEQNHEEPEEELRALLKSLPPP